MSNKKRDLAQELVDFLIKEDVQKKNLSAGKNEKPKARDIVHLVKDVATEVQPRPVDNAQNELQKTIAIIEDPTVNSPGEEVKNEAFEFSVAVPEKASEAVVEEIAVELTSDETLKPEPVKSVSVKVNDPTIPQSYATQRANVVFNDVSALMAGTEAVKVAQARITTLEKDNDTLRNETEQLLTTSESLQRRLNELRAQHEGLERKHREKIEILEDEKSVLRTRLNAKEDELGRIKKENEDLKERFQSDIRKIRVRERELEHRQEIMKAEMNTIVHSKDEAIVELKRQLEKLSFELDNFRAKSADMNAKISEFYDRNHRTVKALRLALSVLEVGESEDKPGKKVG